MLKAQIFEARVFHSRQHEKKHTFAYSLYLFALNIDQKPHWPSFVFSLNPKDYLSGEGTTLRERFDQTCDRFGFDLQAEQVLLLTSARFLGYTFNPVSFWFSYCQKGLLEGVLAEVNNTFGESHFYLMRPKNEGDIQFEHPKQFHVSPFFDRLGSYDWKVQDLQQGLRIQVSYREKDQQRFFASLEGQSLELNPANCWRTILKHPFSPWLTWPRIHIQAGILYFRHKVTFFKKPVPDHPMTFRTSPIWPHEKLAFYLVRRAFSKLKKGQLRLILPDQTELFFGQKNGHVSVLQVRDWSFFAALAYGSDIGFGDSYTDGYWDSPNLLQLLIFFVDNFNHFDERSMFSSFLSRVWEYLEHRLRANSEKQSRHNIHYHYDLGNFLYQKFLCPALAYSSALFENEEISLEMAQYKKIHRILDLSEGKAGQKLLEIGCGFGSFSIEAAKSGMQVSAITLSENQLSLALERAEKAGVNIDFSLTDYRRVQGRFDRIVAIEMLEAVGHEWLPVFFKRCDELLNEGGVIVLQVICMPEQRYDLYLKSCDWLQKRIFPGAVCPSLEAITSAVAGSSGFMITKINDIAYDYARTLSLWRENFNAQIPALEEAGYDLKFQRMWNYYLTYCEAGFRSGYLRNLQIVLKRVGHEH